MRKDFNETLLAGKPSKQSKPSRGMSVAKDERQSTETLSFRCWREWCRLTRGAVVKQRRDEFANKRRTPLLLQKC